MTSFRIAAVEGLTYAGHLVGMFGWEIGSPEITHLSIYAHLHVAASKTAVAAGVDIEDTVGLMGLYLEQHLQTAYVAWEAEPDRTAGDVRAALLDAAQLAVSA